MSEKSREILRYVAVPISFGYSSAEVAQIITESTTVMTHLRSLTSTMTPHRVNHLMRELRTEIRRVTTDAD